MKKIKILAIYKEHLSANRGTPIRVRTILQHLEKAQEIDLSVCSWDKTTLFKKHFHLTNDHADDIRRIRRYVKENSVDLIIGHTIATSYYLLPLKFLTSAKIFLEMHGFMEEEALLYGGIGKFAYWRMKAWTSFFYKTCDLITTSSETATKIISRFNGNVMTIFGAADTNFFRPGMDSADVIKKDGRLVVGYTGNARIWQGLDFLADVFKDFSTTHPEYKLVLLLSEKKGREAYEKEGIECLGPLPHEDVPKFLASCDILVIPRPKNKVNDISFASKLPEYMAMGKPVISSRTSDADTMIDDGVTGLLYEPENREEFEHALLRLKDPDERKRIGEAGRKTIVENYTWERQMERMRIAIQNLFN